MKQFEDAQRGALSLILRTMKSTPLQAIELATTPIDLRIEELQRHEATKPYQNQDSYLSHKIKSYDCMFLSCHIHMNFRANPHSIVA